MTIRPLLLSGLLALALAHPAQASEQRIHVSADSIRVDNDKVGEAARAVGHVTILIPGEVRIKAPEVKLIKGPDGKLAKAIFPGSVRIEELKPDAGKWSTVDNHGGFYDFKTRQYTELHPRGVYEFTPRAGGSKASS